MTPATVAERLNEQTADTTAIRPLRVDVSEADRIELRRRITATRLPDKGTVADFSQGGPLAKGRQPKKCAWDSGRCASKQYNDSDRSRDTFSARLRSRSQPPRCRC